MHNRIASSRSNLITYLTGNTHTNVYIQTSDQSELDATCESSLSNPLIIYFQLE